MKTNSPYTQRIAYLMEVKVLYAGKFNNNPREVEQQDDQNTDG